MTINKSILPLLSHPIIPMECFSNSKANPQRAAKLLGVNEEKWNNNSKMLVGLFEFDDQMPPIISKSSLKAALPFRPATSTLAFTPKNSTLYITSTYPWIVSLYNARTLQLLGTAPSGRYDFDTLSDEEMASIAKFYNPSTSIAHRHTYLASDSCNAVVIDTPELHCVSHKLVCQLSSFVDLVYSGGGGNNPWLLDLETLRKVMLAIVENDCVDFEFADASKIVFRSRGRLYEVSQDQLRKCLDAEGHLSVDAPPIIPVNAVDV
ncbi:hypothetical protein BGZ83_000841 [Gryganskiella cystojenkinii]|nr:hypothetical protein BGZ83_000841 [Gryganskiella cystojenkinii]